MYLLQLYQPFSHAFTSGTCILSTVSVALPSTCCWVGKKWRVELTSFTVDWRRRCDGFPCISKRRVFFLLITELCDHLGQILIVGLKLSQVSDTNGQVTGREDKLLKEMAELTREFGSFFLITLTLGLFLPPGQNLESTKSRSLWDLEWLCFPSYKSSMDLSDFCLVLSPTLSIILIALAISDCVVSCHHLKGSPVGRRQL